MAINPRNKPSLRVLLLLGVLVAALFGGIAAAVQFADPRGSWTPQLGLDLAGGRQIVIEPVVAGDQEVSDEQVEQAVDIIRRRVDGSGVAEAEVSRLGEQNISVAIPGDPTREQLDALSRSSQLRFRAVLAAQPAAPVPQPTQTETPFLPTPSGTGDGEQGEQGQQDQQQDDGDGATQDTGPSPTGSVPEADEASPTDNAAYPQGLLAETSPTDGAEPTATETGPGADEPTDEPTDDRTGGPADTPTAEPTGPSDLAWATPELQQEFAALQCTGTQDEVPANSDPDLPMVACSADGSEKYILGPSELSGARVTDADSGLEPNAQGQPTGRVQVTLGFDDEGAEAFGEITTRLVGYPPNSPQNRFAIVLDGAVISAPTTNDPILDGQASISGSFTSESAETLANQLRFGALPISFTVQTSEQISPTLGEEQLRLGVIAGAIGLFLVFVYSAFQYRALGLVTMGSLLIAASMAYGAVTLLGWSHNFRLTMAGVTGLIIAIGITADSFIVYFERVRDEVRDGRPLRAAVETGWARAKRTIIISDVVNLLAASVLYFLSESGVRAFAFALGLTTIIDLIVVIMFTHPVLTILANTEFFGQGHKWSGLDPERLGAKRLTYAGRGRVSAPPQPRPQAQGGTV